MTAVLNRDLTPVITRPRTWDTGKCRREHDVTDPSNVGIQGASYRCLACERLRGAARRKGQKLPQVVYPERHCVRCGELIQRPKQISLAEWEQRKYCSQAHFYADRKNPEETVLAAYRDTSWAENAACKGVDTEQFFPSVPGRGGSAAIAKAVSFCGSHHCPVSAECLVYGLATDAEGVWGGRYLRPSRQRSDRILAAAS